MELTELIEVVTWSLWIAVGIVVALVSAGFVGGRKRLGYDLFVGVTASDLGGWCSAVIAGDNSKSTLIVSVLCAVFASVLCVWILNRLSSKK